MKSQRAVLLLGCMTMGIVVILFVIDFVVPGRSSVRSARLVESRRMSLFGAKTSSISKASEKQKIDKMDILRMRLDLVNKKLDKVIEAIDDLKSSREFSPIVVKEELAGNEHEKGYSDLNDPEGYSYHFVDKPTSAKPQTSFRHHHHPTGRERDAPKFDSFTAPSEKGRHGMFKRLNETPKKDSEFVPDITGGGNFERFIGELLSDSLNNVARLPMSLDRKGKEELDMVLENPRSLVSESNKNSSNSPQEAVDSSKGKNADDGSKIGDPSSLGKNSSGAGVISEVRKEGALSNTGLNKNTEDRSREAELTSILETPQGLSTARTTSPLHEAPQERNGVNKSTKDMHGDLEERPRLNPSGNVMSLDDIPRGVVEEGGLRGGKLEPRISPVKA